MKLSKNTNVYLQPKNLNLIEVKYIKFIFYILI